MKTIEDLQQVVNKVFLDVLGHTPLSERLQDILKEAIELSRYTDLNHLRQEAGDLMVSLIMLFNEADWALDNTVLQTLDKIKRRKEQYQTLGRKTRVAVFGGAFDMITKGHIETAQLILNTSKKFDEVWLMPCFSHMNGKQMADPSHRIMMCEIASHVDGRIRICDYEINHKLSGETYKLAKCLLNDEEYDSHYSFAFVIGQDNANTFHTWVNFEELERIIPFVVVPRTGIKPDFSDPWYLKSPHTYLVGEKEPIMTSSTQIRMWYAAKNGLIDCKPDQILNGESIENYLEQSVMSYIAENNLEIFYAERGKEDWQKHSKAN